VRVRYLVSKMCLGPYRLRPNGNGMKSDEVHCTKHLAWVLSAILGLVLQGCAAQPRLAWEAIHDQMGTTGVVAAGYQPDSSFENYAPGRQFGALGAGISIRPTQELADPVFILTPLLGGVMAEPKTGNIIKETIEDNEPPAFLLHVSLQERVIERAREFSPQPLVLVTGRLNPEGALASSGQKIDTLLEIALVEIGSEGEIDQLALFMIAQARLVRVQDEMLLVAGKYQFISEKHTPSAWGADSALLLLQTYDQGLNGIAEQMAHDFFQSPQGRLPTISSIEWQTGMPYAAQRKANRRNADGIGSFFFDLYFGQARIAEDTVTASSQQFNIFGSGERFEIGRQVSFRSAPVLGLRLGWWSNDYPQLGAALDVSHFTADGDGVDIDLLPISVLFLIAFPLHGDQNFITARIKPYAGLGIAMTAATSFRVDFQSEPPREMKVKGRGVGPDIRAGLSFDLCRRIALFGEFRYLIVPLKAKDDYTFLGPSFSLGEEVEARTEIRSSQFLGGMSWRF
jgi:hypothetical protein